MKPSEILSWVFKIALVAIFLTAAIPKILDPRAFLAAIETYRLFPYALALAGVYLVPWLEVTCAAGLLSRALRGGSLLILLALMLFFVAIVVISWARGLDITCGCFGGTGETNYPWKVLQNTGIILLLGGVAIFDHSLRNHDRT